MPEDNGHRKEKQPPARMSRIVPGRPGRPSFSLDALRERVERQFQEETADRTDILLDLDTAAKRRELLVEVMDYVLAVEAITLTERDRRTLIDRAYGNLFSFGPLHDYLRDERVTEITVNGPADIHVRHGMGKLTPVEAAFDDRVHLEDILRRVLAMGGAVLSDDSPFLEVGVTLEGRTIRIGVIAPPISPDYSLEIRLHPRQPVTLDDLHERFDAVPPQVATLLKTILAAGRGLLIVGDAGLGKTTLAGALVHTLPPGARLCVVERAAEMHVPDHVARRAPMLAPPGSTFVDEIQNALDEKPDWLIVDEIRGDESAAVHAALMGEQPPRYLWVFRGDSQPDRLRSALSMVIRKHEPAIAQPDIHRALVRCLPVVAAFKRIGGVPRLHLIAEWVPNGEALDLHALMMD
jgi:type IV secretory pathway ATPase VirB11/archaellum biosynthesis ATPase